jgi:hypothetical protein
VTIIAPPDLADGMREVIQKQYPTVLFDLLLTTGNNLEGVAEALNGRVWSNKRFG